MISPNTYTNTLAMGSMLMEYQLVSVLGVGGFGITYLSRDTLLDQDVAIKEYFPSADVSRAENGTVTVNNSDNLESYKLGLERFLKEARTLAGFSHPHIVSVKRFFKANGTGYMVMSYERGMSLKQYFQNHESPSEETLKSILGLLLDGIRLVHEVGFLHRDIKPDNIFIREDGKPVLLDFGSARNAMGGADRTMTTLITPGYAPFEQYTAKSEQGPWTDIYALGGVLYYGVTGENPPDALTRLKEDTVTDVLVRAQGRYSDAFLDAIVWAMQPDEKKRPQTVLDWRRKILRDVVDAPAVQPDLLIDDFGGARYTAIDEFGPSTMMGANNTPTRRTHPQEVDLAIQPEVAPKKADPATASLDTQDISKFLEKRDALDRAVKAKFQRVLSVMFTDLKGSTAIAEAHGDIAVRGMLKRYHDLCHIAVQRNGGTFVKTIGDGSLSHFEHASSACRAACDIQRGMEEINLSHSYKTLLLTRIGIHTGECILEKNDIFGDVVNTASRFESSANSGEILISEETYNALADKSEFYARFDREVTLKGKSSPFNAYIVFWDPTEAERDKTRPQTTLQEKGSTPIWKIALYLGLPLIIVLAATLWFTGSGTETRRTIDHSIPAGN